MKKLLMMAFFFAALSGCSGAIREIPLDISVYGIDFTKYTDSGFMFTPYQYQGKYKSVGIMTGDIFPEMKYLDASVDENGIDMTKPYGWNVVLPFQARRVIDSIYRVSKAMGADALVDIKFSEKYRDYNIGTPQYLRLYGISITGFALKRID